MAPPDLRHTAPGLVVAAAANAKALQRIPGQDVYAGLFGDDLDAVAHRWDEAVAAQDKDRD